MSHIELAAEIRSDVGKGASRRLRRQENRVPAILYGGEEASLPITFLHKDVLKIMENESFYTQLLTLHVGGEKYKAILRDIHHHPYKPKVVHLDFQRITGKEKLVVHTPLHFIGEAECPAILNGGIVTHHLKDVEVSCSPLHLPEYIAVDISHLEMDGVIHLSELPVPEGVTILALTHGEEHDLPVVSAHMPRIVEEEEPATVAVEEVEGEAGETTDASKEGEKADGGEPKAKKDKKTND